MAQEHPDNRKYLIQWYNAAKLQPASQDYHQAAKQLLKLPDKNPETLKLIRTVFHEYMSKAKPKPLIDTQLLLSVVTSLAAGGHPQEADKLLPLLKNHKDKNKLAEATLIIANAFNKTHDYEKYRACLITIVTEHAQTQTAHNANARLRELNITR
jgi:tetratricopeptide (TPR) repeat protein